MRRLVQVELTRFRSRRGILVLAALAVLVAVVLASWTAYHTRPLSASDKADAAAQADLGSRSSALQGELKDCRSDPQTYLGPNATAAQCTAALVPGVTTYYPRQALSVGSLLEQPGPFRSTGLGLAMIVLGLMIVAGCTFAGADWGSGSLTTQLLFEPRRGRLWLAKAAAVLLGSGLVSLVTLAGFWTALVAVSDARGITVPGAVATQVVWHVVRAVAVTAAAAVGAFALTMVFRHTVATLALLFVYSVGGELLLGLVPFQGAGRFSIGNNVFGWLSPHGRYFDPTISCTNGAGCDVIQVMTHLEGGLFLLGLVLVAGVVSVLWFRRSDV